MYTQFEKNPVLLLERKEKILKVSILKSAGFSKNNFGGVQGRSHDSIDVCSLTKILGMYSERFCAITTTIFQGHRDD
ncbi:hypothetical protein E2C01_073200 [Portunus trituberculatus]|uniref:Uncharacterized protein n=1 Tax=Portunus trituberculatus TaxID=210409 RepID=A0A5B7I984_PORTR|nr:hypothetical protein [Portunus trituberculatus]